MTLTHDIITHVTTPNDTQSNILHSLGTAAVFMPMSVGVERMRRDLCTISNCVCTFNITNGQPIDLGALARAIDAVEYSPKKFAAASMRLMSPKSTALVFSSGAVVVTGAPTEYQGLMAGRRYTLLLRQADPTFTFRQFSIQNVVGSANLGGVVHLRELSRALGEAAQYEPELFPGLVLRMQDQPCCCMMFRSGNCIVTGGRSSDEVRSVFRAVRQQVQHWVGAPGEGDGNSARYAAGLVRQRVATGYAHATEADTEANPKAKAT